MEGLDRTIIEGGDGFGGASMLAGGAGFVGGLVLGSLWNGGYRFNSLHSFGALQKRYFLTVCHSNNIGIGITL